MFSRWHPESDICSQLLCPCPGKGLRENRQHKQKDRGSSIPWVQSWVHKDEAEARATDMVSVFGKYISWLSVRAGGDAQASGRCCSFQAETGRNLWPPGMNDWSSLNEQPEGNLIHAYYRIHTFLIEAGQSQLSRTVLFKMLQEVL